MEQIKVIFCNTCKVETKHNLISIHTRFVNGDQIRHFELSEWAEAPDLEKMGSCDTVHQYKLWVCRGCDTATLQESCTHRMLIHESDSTKSFWIYTFHPKRAAEHRVPKNFVSLPANLWFIYHEVIDSFNSQAEILTAIGLRALLEGICIDKGITDGVAWGLQAKLKALDKGKHLPSSIVKGLGSFKFIGDEAAHKLERPAMKNLSLAIDVMEELLSFLYSLDAKANFLLRQVTQNRLKKPESNSGAAD